MQLVKVLRNTLKLRISRCLSNIWISNSSSPGEWLTVPEICICDLVHAKKISVMIICVHIRTRGLVVIYCSMFYRLRQFDALSKFSIIRRFWCILKQDMFPFHCTWQNVRTKSHKYIPTDIQSCIYDPIYISVIKIVFLCSNS